MGTHYDRAIMAEVRDRTREAVRMIGARIVPGMDENAANAIARRTLRELGLLRGWHGIFVRFGPNTLKFYGAPSDPGVVLGEDDILIVDIGPVWKKWEGDAGDTFVTGSDPEMRRARDDVHKLFGIVRDHWADTGTSGRELYNFAEDEARAMGWELNLELGGHRLGDFPHALVHEGALAEADFIPSPDLWVLEMHIRHPSRRFGAFYEDMLLSSGDEDATQQASGDKGGR